MLLSALHVYPIKGCGGIALEECAVTDRGLRHDRRFMLVDERGRFLTQREHAKLALVRTAFDGDALAITAGERTVRVPLEGVVGARRPVTVWSSDVEGVDCGREVAELFSSFLGFSCALVHMPDDVRRTVSTQWAHAGEIVSYADAFPFLLTTEGSLADVNARLASGGSAPVPMNRFRPNLVVRGSDAWAEDGWSHVRIGALEFSLAKPCDRCIVTTIDQETAQKGAEPLRTLSTFRAVFEERQSLDGRVSTQRKVLFGWNLLHRETGVVRRGDPVVVVAR